MGEIPERSIFRQKGLRTALKPYLQLTQVRVGAFCTKNTYSLHTRWGKKRLCALGIWTGSTPW